jgi:hypothetical protein
VTLAQASQPLNFLLTLAAKLELVDREMLRQARRQAALLYSIGMRAEAALIEQYCGLDRTSEASAELEENALSLAG